VSLTVKLSNLSICPCGESVLDQSIPLGTEYQVHPETIQRGFAYRCGKCGEAQSDVAVIFVENRDGLSGGVLPLALFDLPGIAA
jgi:hypothetical protein